MASLTKDELLRRTKAEIREISADDAKRRLDQALFLDVREADEVATGQITGATHLPRGFLEMKIEDLVRDHDREIIVYCAGGNRSAFAAKTLGELGYTRVSSLVGGFGGWKNKALPWSVEPKLSSEQLTRYSRHLSLSEVGEEGQKKLL